MKDNPYATLQAEKREIRLMTLAAGTLEDGIEVSLSTTTLEQEPRYETLSYVWGNPAVTKTIKLNGHSFEVTTNLEAALRQLRPKRQNRTFWVDAICINQKDIPERNSQVTLMRDIFTSCSKCIVWLGEEDENTKDMMHCIGFLSQDNHLYNWLTFRNITETHDISNIEYDTWRQFFVGNPQPFQALQSLMSKAWWTRVWTVQEFVLPKDVELVCGPYAIDRHTLMQATVFMVRHIHGCCYNLYAACPPAMRDVLLLFNTRVRALETLRRTCRHDLGMNPINILSRMHFRQASDLKDHVYASLGLTYPKARDSIKPDYTLEISAVFSEITVLEIESQRSLKILGCNFSKKPSLLLPSWVPDWSTSEQYSEHHFRRLNRYHLFKSSDGTSFNAQIQIGTLQLFGLKHTTVTQVSSLLEAFPSPAEILTLNQWSHSNSDIARVMHNDCVWDNDGTSDERAVPSDHDALVKMLSSMTNIEEYEPIVDIEGEGTISDSILHRRFFHTDNGELGLGPALMQTGDEIWLVCGGNLPLVLRSVGNDVTPSESREVINQFPRYALVGDCYVDGIMDGEAAGGLKTNAFEIHLV